MLNTATLVNEASKEIEAPAQLQIKVRAERKGSWLTDIVLQAAETVAVVSPLLNQENIENAKAFGKGVIDLIAGVIKLRKHTGGEKPTSVTKKGDGTVDISGNNFGTINIKQNIFNMYNKPDVEEAVDDTFEVLDDDPDVNSYELLDEDEQSLVAVNKNEFEQLAAGIEEEEPEKRTLVENDADLAVIRQSFEADKTCTFLYKGNQITALIADENFWKTVDRGERFAKGDRLFADLEISQEFDRAINEFKNKGYKVLWVKEHIRRERQPDLFSPETDEES